MKSKYDILVIGGGPAGALAAKTAAEAGNSVCLIEKRPAIGTPVRCAEGIGKELLKEFVKPDPRWISADIERARLIAPNGTTIALEQDRAGNEVGYVLDRKVFDRELVWQAAEAGADVAVKTRATAPIMENGAVRGANVISIGRPAEIRAEVVIAADGTEAQFARRAGLDTVVPLREMMSCAQYLMTDIDIDAGSTDFYLGNERSRPKATSGSSRRASGPQTSGSASPAARAATGPGQKTTSTGLSRRTSQTERRLRRSWAGFRSAGRSPARLPTASSLPATQHGSSIPSPAAGSGTPCTPEGSPVRWPRSASRRATARKMR